MQTTVLGQKSTSLKSRLAGRGAGLTLSALLSLTLASAGVHAQQPASPGNPMSAKESQNHQAVGMYNLGLSAYQQGSLESAIIFFRRATDLDPNLADAQYNLGVLYQSQRRAKEAIPRFQEVLRVKPSDADAPYQLGLALMEMGRPAEAKTHFASIAPNSTHFADAQKRTQVCDAQMSGATIATPSYSPNPVETPPLQNQMQPALSQSQPQMPAPVQQASPSYSEQSSYQQAYPTLSSQMQPQQPVQQPQQPAYREPAAVAPAVAATAPKVAARPVSTTGAPTAVLANTSVRVIATGFSAPSGLTFDRSGNLYVANYETNSVDRISADGTRTQFSSGAHLKGPIGLAADDSGNIYVANYESNTVARITPAGISTIIGTGFKRPYYLTLDREGNLFVSQQQDNSIARISLPRAVVSR